MIPSRTWTLKANPERARLFRHHGALDTWECVVDLDGNAERIEDAAARELEFACGYQTDDSLILEGEFRLISRICQRLPDSVRSRIAKIVPNESADRAA